ncbi:hypothetical protein ACE6H2_006707 [Prunus campanulata]
MLPLTPTWHISDYLTVPSIKISKKDWAHGHLMAIYKYFHQGLEFLSNPAGFWACQELAQPHHKKSHMLSVGYAVDGRGVGGLSAMGTILFHPTPGGFDRLVKI